ncbi:hypothetical protein L2Y96_06295 [Luteibacter aegosomaticola]|uniref:hypothetical protein n=1 Tax=Luteibacter aegosomaticola TaxID=2911538 RepID=UPI001FF7E390|nr:hypothetical protein [Luteibacter aegosomaticola]UPG91380.1 hypothetical protein L2Y96_06295 [Luteibacter aegosomaticola]
MRYTTSTAALFALCLVAAPVQASTSPDPSRLPACTSAGNDDACRLPIRDGDFSAGALNGWQRQGLPVVGYDASGNAYAALPVGAAISQAVGIPTANLPQDVAYAIRFRVLGESADGSIDVRVALSDDNGNQKIDLGGTTVRAVRGEWTVGELFVTGKQYGGAPHVHITLANDSASGTQVQVDDVHVVESAGVEAG